MNLLDIDMAATLDDVLKQSLRQIEESIEESISLRHEQLASQEKTLRIRVEQVKLREERVLSAQESINSRFNEVQFFHQRCTERVEKGLSFLENSIDKRIEDASKLLQQSLAFLDLKETQLSFIVDAHQNQCSKDFELKDQRIKEFEKAFHLKEEMLEDFAVQVELKNKRAKEFARDLQFKQTKLQEWANQLESSHKERAAELESKELRFEERTKAFSRKDKSLEDWSMQIKSKDIRAKELEFKDTRVQKLAKDLEQKELRFEERNNAFNRKEKRLEDWSVEIEFKDKRAKEFAKELESKNKRVRERATELELKESRYEQGMKVFSRESKKLEEYIMEVELKDKQARECEHELELRVRRGEEYSKELELKEKRLEDRSVEIELKDESFKERVEKLESKEKSLENIVKQIDSKKNILEEKAMEIESKEKELAERTRNVELRENTLEQSLKYNTLKENQFIQRTQIIGKKEIGLADIGSNEVKCEPSETPAANTDARLSGNSDGNSLLIFLTKNCGEHDWMHYEVAAALRASPDPGKLVLDAIQGFYPSNTGNENPGVKLSIIRKSCILLLEELMKISPEIKPNVQYEVIEHACDWMAMIKMEDDNYMMVLGFLLLLAAYGVAHAFTSDELVTYLLLVARDRQAPKLCRILGLVDKISDFIRYLIRIRKDLDAIRLVYAFMLVDKFRPGDMLRTYLKKSERACKIGKGSGAAQGTAVRKRITELEAAVWCIKEHNLQSEYPLKSLQDLIAQLNDRLETTIKCSLPSSCGPTPYNEQEQTRAFKRPRTDSPSAPFNHSPQVPHQKPSGVIIGQDTTTSNLDKSTQKAKGWNLSFQALMNCPPNMKAHRKGAAMKLAANLKVKLDSNIEKRDVFCFFQLIASYGLASSFDADELLDLFEYIFRCEKAPELYFALGLPDDKIPKFISNLVAKEQLHDAVKYILAYGLKDKLPLVPLLKNYISKMKAFGKTNCEKQNNSSCSQVGAITKEISASKVVLKCILAHKLESEYPPKILEDRIEVLEKEKQDIRNTVKAPSRSPVSESQSKELSGNNKRPRTLESKETAGGSHKYTGHHGPPTNHSTGGGHFNMVNQQHGYYNHQHQVSFGHNNVPAVGFCFPPQHPA